MAYLIGTDEAGYGPNLGPLVIVGTLWQVPDGVDGEKLYELLPAVEPPDASNKASSKRVARPTGGSRPLTIGDSKSLYRPNGGLTGLERGVFAALATVDRKENTSTDASVDVPATWRELLERCDPECAATIDAIPWYADFNQPVPVDALQSDIDSAVATLRRAIEESESALLAIRARIVFPQAFNDRVTECDSKGQALSLWTLELVAELLQLAPQGPILVQCDKHGGRNRYAGLLQHVFPEHFIEVHGESRQRSAYCWGPPSRRVETRFIAKGERFLPAALASMFAKYLRELSMLAFNAFWRHHVPEVRSTAGYPVDAKRFRAEIQSCQKRLAISDHMLWRAR